MRTRKTAFALALFAVALIVFLRIAGRPSAETPAIAISILGYTNWHEYVCPRIRLTNLGRSSVTYDGRATGPSGWMKVELTNGWTDKPLSSMTGATEILRPGSSVVFWTVVPANALRWQFGFAVRTASLRERAYFRFPGGWWNQVHPICEWPRLLSHKTGPECEIQSEVFELGQTNGATAPLHNLSLHWTGSSASALAAREADESSIRITLFPAGSSNEVFVISNTATNGPAILPGKGRAVDSLVESNGLYSIDIEAEPPEDVLPRPSSKVDRPQEVVPPSINDHPIDMPQMLFVYAEFTGAELDIGEGVREVREYLPLKSTPAMTRAQVVDLFDGLLLDAGVVVTHPDTKHAVFRLKQ